MVDSWRFLAVRSSTLGNPEAVGCGWHLREVVAASLLPGAGVANLAEDACQLVWGERQREGLAAGRSDLHDEDTVAREHLPAVAVQVDTRSPVNHQRQFSVPAQLRMHADAVAPCLRDDGRVTDHPPDQSAGLRPPSPSRAHSAARIRELQ
jgi:hypothetical protein